ncbi:MAG: saccharopine dehydrogenase family protein [Solirubrobacterales bacterium]
MTSERDLDVVVFGATSVTGRRVAAYLDERVAEVGASWGAAGRDAGKVKRVLAEVGVTAPVTLSADVGDSVSLEAMAARAKVVLNLVGPYTRYGKPVIEACVAGGAHYVDLTGEIPFVRRVIDEFDAAATGAGVKIVQVCGFEALPPDLAVTLAAEAAAERWSESLAEVDLDVTTTAAPPGLPRPSDFMSGGTIQSMVEIAADEGTSELTDPAVLLDSPAEAGEVRRLSPISVAPRRGEDGNVIAPMVPAAFLNPAVIHRSASLRAAGRGETFAAFRYREGFVLPGGSATLAPRFAAAGILSGAQAGLSGLTRAPLPVRRQIAAGLRRVLPSSGFGPAADRLEDWKWRIDVDARTSGGNRVAVEVLGEGHPGYLTTATMLGEAGLLLAEDEATPDRSGCLTPATALGTASADRFVRAKLAFKVS